MGVIRRVFDTRMERLAALEIIDTNLAEHDEMRARFLDEARITGQLDHPNILPVHDIITDDAGQPSAFMMKLVDGKTLADPHPHRPTAIRRRHRERHDARDAHVRTTPTARPRPERPPATGPVP